MNRYHFEVKLDQIYSDIIHWGKPSTDHSSTFVFYFDQPVNGLDRLVVFCSADGIISTSEDPARKRLVSRYPFADYPSFARFQLGNGSSDGTVYGVWETDTSGQVTKFALQLWRPGGSYGKRPSEMDERA